MINVKVDPGVQVDIQPKLLEGAALSVLENQGKKGGLTIVLTDDVQLQKLNREYLGIDSPTDVLSFPASETDPETGHPYLGDIIISAERAGQQALEAGHEERVEILLLVVHGTLHLLGHDHDKMDAKDRMWAAQAEILELVGLKNVQIRE